MVQRYKVFCYNGKKVVTKVFIYVSCFKNYTILCAKLSTFHMKFVHDDPDDPDRHYAYGHI